MIRPFVLLAFLFVCVAAAGAQTPGSAENETTNDPEFVPKGVVGTWAGVYTTDQAVRGQTLYVNHCSSCHRADLSGFGGVLIGAYFLEAWRDDTLRHVVDLIQKTMPRRNPGSLPENEYIDILAYVLQKNSFPSGPKELAAADLDHIWVAGKEGPGAILPFGSLVKVVGCLTPREDKAWELVNGSNPLRTRNPDDSAGPELEAARTRSLGDQIYGLRDVNIVHPNDVRGHKLEAKGFLTKQPGGGLIFVTSLKDVAAACGR